MTSHSRPTLEDTLAAILDQLQQSNTLLGLVLGEGQSGNASSVQIEDAAKGSPRVTTKVYAGSVPDVDGAIEAHARAHRLADQAWRDDWKDTLAYVREQQAGQAINPSPVLQDAREPWPPEILPDFPEVRA